MKQHPTNGQQYKHTYLTGPMGLFAVHIIKPNGSEEINYIHTDHLGSWNTITDENGNLKQEQSFDAWGNRRDPATWRAFTTTAPEPIFDRGFTGHEHLYAFNLINMNGRFYDPIIGRMLSLDNFMQAPDYTQSFNRYSYCLNNPLLYTDPTGDVFMMPFFMMGMIADYTSNRINGVENPLGTAYNNVTSMITGINNAAQFNLVRTENFNLSIGIDPFSYGVSVNATYQSGDNDAINFSAGINPFGANINLGYTRKIGDFAFSLGGGYNSGYGSFLAKSPSKISGMQAHYGVSYFDRVNKQYFSFGGVTNGGKHNQNQWYVGYRKGDFSFAMTNDAFRGSDWYRTAAAEIGVGEVSFGFNLFTTKPPLEEYKKGFGENSEYKSRWGFNKKGVYSGGERVYAGLYLGYRNGNRVSRFGIDGPGVQEFTQNFIHGPAFPLINAPYFDTRLGSPSTMFLQGGYINPFSLYPF